MIVRIGAISVWSSLSNRGEISSGPWAFFQHSNSHRMLFLIYFNSMAILLIVVIISDFYSHISNSKAALQLFTGNEKSVYLKFSLLL